MPVERIKDKKIRDVEVTILSIHKSKKRIGRFGDLKFGHVQLREYM